MNFSSDFQFKPFQEMTAEDYDLVGLKCGLEIHQQILTRRKLFCRCPAGLYSRRVDAEILRHMRPTLSELGEYDGTALMEFKTKKEIIYQLNQESVCTYEMDDAPPFEIDPEAVKIALEISLMLDLNLVSELHIARKQYLDGSIPTGFQRTTILGVDGHIVVNGRKIGIIQLGLEEDSCREVSDAGHRITFRTDRLGMPLIETVTYPELLTPQETAKAAEVIRRLTRASGKVRTGAGAAREDVNVSVAGGTRVEIKGVPSIKRIPHLIYNEALRQHNLLKIKEKLLARGLDPQRFETPSARVTHIVQGTAYLPIQLAIEQGGVVEAIRLEGFNEILAHSTQENTYFAGEISDRVKVIACLMDHPNILHTDATETGLSRGQWNRIRKRLRANMQTDTLVLVWGNEEDVETAINEIAIRAREALIGVPPETRQALRDGTNGFERILPGADRMYPDTDTPPLAIEDEMVEVISGRLVERPWECDARLRKLGVPEAFIHSLTRCRSWLLFDPVLEKSGCDPRLLTFTILRDLRYFRRKGYDLSRLDSDRMAEVFRRVSSGELERGAVTYILRDFLADENLAFKEAVNRYVPTGGEIQELEGRLIEAGDMQHTLISRQKSARLRYLCGFIMYKMRGRIPAAEVTRRLQEVVTGDDDES